jgi:hypothetical protein
MYPAVPPPKGLVGRSVDFKLKPGWRYDEAKGIFVNSRGAQFVPPPLPKKTRILYKVPSLARSSSHGLSRAERDLQRYMQVLIPNSEAPEQCVKTIQTWPCVEEAHAAPEVSLPMEQSPREKTARGRRRGH